MPMQERYDPEVLELIPHRPPMLLINKVLNLSNQESSALVQIDSESPFYKTDMGVPSWIGLEYMGQTAALIAGFQLRAGTTPPHLGFLMGSRKYTSDVAFFTSQEDLVVTCKEAAVVGGSLATFNCTITTQNSKQQIASAILSVFRKPLAA